MCGIVGVLAHGQFATKKEERVRQEAMIYLTTELLSLTQARGKDATGVAVSFADGDYAGLKMGVSALEFITRFGGKETDYDGFLKIWRRKLAPARMVIGHCRKPSTTVGAGTEDNANNHPIKVGDTIGVHNGTLTNHEKIFQNLDCKRDSTVDSEAIFRLLNHLTSNGADPFTLQVVQETCQRLHGTYACLAFNGNNPFQMVGFRDGRPMEFALIKPLKLLLVASEKDYLKIAVTRYNKMAYLYQMGSLKFPGLTKGDFEVGVTTDDSAYLFDVTQEVTSETKLIDLYQTEKIPRTNKLWGKTTATVTGNQWQNRHRNNGVGNAAQTTGAGAVGATGAAGKKTGTEVDARPAGGGLGQAGGVTGTTQTQTSTDTGAADHRIGMVWNRSSYRYEDVEGAKKTVDDHKSVIIDIEEGTVVDLTTNETLIERGKKAGTTSSAPARPPIKQGSGSFELERVTQPCDDLITDPAKIRVADVADVTPPSTNVSTGVSGNGIYSIHRAERKVIDPHELAVDSAVLEKAVDASRDVPGFSNDEECADALEILDASAMNTMARYSLVNRAKNQFYKLGWYDGHMVAKLAAKQQPVKTPENSVDMYARTMLERMKQGKNRTATTIRVMKVLIGILAEAVGHSDAAKEVVMEKVAEAIAAGKEINVEALEKAFKPGDRAQLPAIDAAINAMKFLVEDNVNGKGEADSHSV